MKPPSLIRALAVLSVLLLSLRASHAEPQPVIKLTLHDTIQPISASYLERGLNEARLRNASAVLLSLGTPGGLLDSTRSIVQSIERSPVPVIVYISPTGSRAGSAGFFILEAADVAAMAPGTNAGAAHPIVEGRQIDPILKEKIENDAAAFLRSYASRRGRNLEAAEDAIRTSKSYSDEEALRLRLIDIIAADDSSLLAQLDGHLVHRLNGATATLHTAHAPVIVIEPSLRERLLGRLANPDFAVVMLIFGALLVYLEFNVPGTIVPGAIGTLLIVLGMFGLNLLPIHYTSVFMLVAALALIVLEAKFSSHGALGLAGTAALIFGLVTLVDGPIPEQRVHTSIAIALGLGFGVITFLLAFIALKARRNKILTGPQALVGTIARTRTLLAPSGQVEVRGEIWQARLLDPQSQAQPPETQVQVRAVQDLTLLVSACEQTKSAKTSQSE